MTLPRPIRIAGVGSPHGDDAVAWRIVERLREALGEAPEIGLHRLEGAERLLDLLDARGTLVVLDAADDAGAPGAMTSFSWPDDRLLSLRAGTTHDLGVDAALRLAGAIGTLPGEVRIYAVAAASFQPGDEPSPMLAAAVPDFARRILSDLGLAEPE